MTEEITGCDILDEHGKPAAGGRFECSIVTHRVKKPTTCHEARESGICTIDHRNTKPDGKP